MPSTFLTDFIAAIHRNPAMAVLVVTGGGSQALADLFVVPGASRTVLEALVPYGDRSLRMFLGAEPRQAASAESAAMLARKAHERAVSLGSDQDVAFLGVACTAALVTDRPRRGEHRVHVAVCHGGSTDVYSVVLEKNTRTREEEERVAADLLLFGLGHACGLDAAVCDTLLPSEPVQRIVSPA